MNYTIKALGKELSKVKIIHDTHCYNSGHSEGYVVILPLLIILFSLNQIDALLPRKLAKRSKSIMRVQQHLALVTAFNEGQNK